MKKTGGVFANIMLLILLILLAGASYFLYLNWPRTPIALQQTNTQGSVHASDLPANYSSVSKQFYPNMRYTDRHISYSISSVCDDSRKSSMEEAFVTIADLTTLTFYPAPASTAQINVLCSDVAPEANEKDHFVAGEGGPSEVLNSSLYSVILKGKIALYRPDKCHSSKIAIHELLHALGFDHNRNPKSIMYPTLSCDQEIDPQLITDIKNLYATDALPELSVYDVKASKGGKYLNFDISVMNGGLVDASAVTLSVYADTTFIKDFELSTIEIGARKILNVENLKIPASATKISFVVDKNNDIPELIEDNNKEILVLS